VVGPNPTDRGKPGSKVFEELVDAVGLVKLPGRDRPRKRPEKLHADKAYDYPRCREVLRRRGIKSRISRRGKTPASGCGGIGGWWSARWRCWHGTL
jgi:hypothetical protein